MKRKPYKRKRGHREPPRPNGQPSTYQPSKAELEADMSIDATPLEVAEALVSGGAPRRESRNLAVN